MRIASSLWCGCFLLAAALQYNDPDPLRWMAIYLAAALAAGWRVRGPVPPWLPGLIALVALVWAATLVPGVLREAEWSDLVRTMKKENHAEEARELGGLVLVAAWMVVLCTRSLRRKGR